MYSLLPLKLTSFAGPLMLKYQGKASLHCCGVQDCVLTILRRSTLNVREKHGELTLLSNSQCGLLDSTIAAPPTLNRQLGISMERSFPKYQFCVMFSVLTTRQF